LSEDLLLEPAADILINEGKAYAIPKISVEMNVRNLDADGASHVIERSSAIVAECWQNKYRMVEQAAPRKIDSWYLRRGVARQRQWSMSAFIDACVMFCKKKASRTVASRAWPFLLREMRP
jgi:hypothetical protein